MIARLFYSQLPYWARPSHPIMRSVIGGYQPETVNWRNRLLRLLLGVGLVVLVLALGYAAAENNTENDEPTIREVLYGPLVFAQTIAVVLALALTSNAIAIERQKQTWDSLKLTTVGASLTLRARWIAVFFRLKWLLLLILIGRLVFIGVMMRDLTDFQGRALDLYISGITPEISLNVAVLLMAGFMTAFILQPFVEVALGAAIGLFLAAITKARSIVILGLLMLAGVRILITVGGLTLDEDVFEGALNMPQNEAWARLLFGALQGDMSLDLFHLETLGQVWADVENTVYVGGVILAIVLVQAIVSNGLVLLAAWGANRPTRV